MYLRPKYFLCISSRSVEKGAQQCEKNEPCTYSPASPRTHNTPVFVFWLFFVQIDTYNVAVHSWQLLWQALLDAAEEDTLYTLKPGKKKKGDDSTLAEVCF